MPINPPACLGSWKCFTFLPRSNAEVDIDTEGRREVIPHTARSRGGRILEWFLPPSRETRRTPTEGTDKPLPHHTLPCRDGIPPGSSPAAPKPSTPGLSTVTSIGPGDTVDQDPSAITHVIMEIFLGSKTQGWVDSLVNSE